MSQEERDCIVSLIVCTVLAIIIPVVAWQISDSYQKWLMIENGYEEYLEESSIGCHILWKKLECECQK
jgi:hypothetical protein